MSDDENVTKLPIRFKNPTPEERTIVRLHEIGRREECSHSHLMGCSYVYDEKLSEVECSKCGAKLNPMWVLGQIASEDRRLNEAQRRYQEEQKRLAERTRTKCEHCDRMTRISRR